jgi:hypothetical protein
MIERMGKIKKADQSEFAAFVHCSTCRLMP